MDVAPHIETTPRRLDYHVIKVVARREGRREVKREGGRGGGGR